ncbi:hypothetical protein VDP73_05095 [Xanthomonas campestris pv. campestris]|uniref:hypothetical protein n=1 Tax=Xanthomonas campestris TaxID=339 RepID=UPI002AD214F8|nr:hypothetical protein [Xanthomonas campestris]MEA0862752.1 hypothetical protein [Xanthomonas campestris pv. campestris]MEA9913991.1 hypothetical protein [Xanthomonas campestris pv. raphani]MEB1176316.1 hypothetical protein [Xanthomonas campestris pv. campestris]MEB1230773.1 hypothetical protein [Xanthomonas campestris pv. campestris]MEB1254973.1 hypothetical protein [Xanthomonas campestris pv. campestris]
MSTVSQFGQACALVAIGLSGSLETSQEDQFSELRDAVAARIAHGQSCLEDAERAFDAGDIDSGWLSLVRAGIEAGAVNALLEATYITPRALAAKTGREKATQAFKERRVAAVKHFLANFRKPCTMSEAIAKLEASMEFEKLKPGPNARTVLYKQHPEVKRLIGGLPLKPKKTR